MGEGLLLCLSHILSNVPCFVLMGALFWEQWRRSGRTVILALYAFLLIRTVYTAIVYIILNIFMLAHPGQYIGFDKTPLYTLTVLLVGGAAFPFLWRYFIRRLRVAFSVLSDATIRQLCVPPVLFFLLDQCYSSIRSTLQYDSFQTAAIFVLMFGNNGQLFLQKKEQSLRLIQIELDGEVTELADKEFEGTPVNGCGISPDGSMVCLLVRKDFTIDDRSM